MANAQVRATQGTLGRHGLGVHQGRNACLGLKARRPVEYSGAVMNAAAHQRCSYHPQRSDRHVRLPARRRRAHMSPGAVLASGF